LPGGGALSWPSCRGRTLTQRFAALTAVLSRGEVVVKGEGKGDRIDRNVTE
jgi:hypothetical protein